MPSKMTLSKINPTVVLLGLLAVGVGSVMGSLVVKMSNPMYAVYGIIAVVVGLYIVKVALLDPEKPLLFLVFMIYVNLNDVLQKFHGTPSILLPYLGFIIFLVIFRWWQYGEKPSGWGPITAFVVAYQSITMGSILWAPDPDRIMPRLDQYQKAQLVAIFITFFNHSAVTLRRVIWALMLVSIILGTLAIHQEVRQNYTDNYGGFSVAQERSITGNMGKGGGEFRIAGPNFQPNDFSVFLLALLPLAMNTFWTERGLKNSFFASWSLIACLGALILTYSRSAFLCMVVVVFIMFIFRPPSPKIIVMIIFLSILCLPLIPAKYMERMSSFGKLASSEEGVTQDASLKGRLSENLAGIAMFKDHPFFGVGFYHFSYYYQSYARRFGIFDELGEDSAPHNLFLQIGSELGLIGAVWFGSMNVYLLWNLWQARQNFLKAGLPDSAGTAVALGVAGISFLISGIFCHVSYARMYWLIYGIMFSVPNVARRELQIVSQLSEAQKAKVLTK
jgi:O-antigen ligase